MEKNDFLSAIQKKLEHLPQKEQKITLDYYEQMINYYLSIGLSTIEAVSQLEHTEKTAVLLTELYQNNRVSVSRIPKWSTLNKSKKWGIALTSPLWFSLLFLLTVLCLGVAIVPWVLLFTLVAFNLILFVCTVSAMFSIPFLMYTGNAMQALFLFGAGLISAGFAILVLFACKKSLSLLLHFGNWLYGILQKKLQKKEEQ